MRSSPLTCQTGVRWLCPDLVVLMGQINIWSGRPIKEMGHVASPRKGFGRRRWEKRGGHWIRMETGRRKRMIAGNMGVSKQGRQHFRLSFLMEITHFYIPYKYKSFILFYYTTNKEKRREGKGREGKGAILFGSDVYSFLNSWSCTTLSLHLYLTCPILQLPNFSSR